MWHVLDPLTKILRYAPAGLGCSENSEGSLNIYSPTAAASRSIAMLLGNIYIFKIIKHFRF